MPSTRTALLIVTSTYTDSTFSRLRAPRHDATALAEVLRDPEIGGYRVSVLDDEPSHTVRMRIDEVFRRSNRDDLILLYVSGHGIKDEAGRLHLATTDTRRDLLASTALPAAWVREQIDHSPARKVVVWLDCCYGGAFPPGMIPKAEGTVDVLPQLSDDTGRGCAVMTASTHIQFAFEHGDALNDEIQPSVFTNAIIEGLRTGDADRNTDGEIDANELYNYVYDRVKSGTPNQTPTRNHQVTGELYIAHSRRGLHLHPDLPTEIRQALRSTRPGFRRTAVTELVELAETGDPTQRAIATDALNQLRAGPDADLARTAEQAICHLDPSPPPVTAPASTPVIDPASIELPDARPFMPRRLVRRSPVFLVFGALATVAFVPYWLGSQQDYYYVIGWICLVLAMGTLGVLVVPAYRFFADTSSVTLLEEEFAPSPTAFRPDGGLLVCAGDSALWAWDTCSWERRELDIRPAAGGRSVAFSPDGAVLVVATMRGGIQIRNGRTLEAARDLGEFEAKLVAFSPSGEYLATVTDDQIRVWDTTSWTVEKDLWVGGRTVRSIAFSPDGRVLATAGSMVRMWSTRDWSDLRAPSGLVGFVRSVRFSPDGTLLAGAGDPGSVTLCSMTTGEVWKLRRPRGNSGPMTFSPAGDLLASCSWNGIRLWHTGDWSLERTLVGHQQYVTSLTFSPDGSVLASTGLDGTLKLWRISA